ncbi:MAG: DUF2461 domain-containing protein [Planctomycetales bacterium]|nr:DUF2461 domain-containing protein [Planctomycetales bacterium]
MVKSLDFAGFPRETLAFLCGIRANNSKKWFESHRVDYENYFVQPAKQFVSAAAAKLGQLDPAIVAEPRINGSIFRINRDVRFSADKRPYKDHLDLLFWVGDKKSTASALFFRASPDMTCIGAGHYGCPQLLNHFRAAVADPDAGKELAAIAKKLRKAGYELKGEHYQRMPRNFPSDGPAAEFLLHQGLYIVVEESPDAACSAKLLDNCVKQWKAMLPLHRWLTTHVVAN